MLLTFLCLQQRRRLPPRHSTVEQPRRTRAEILSWYSKSMVGSDRHLEIKPFGSGLNIHVCTFKPLVYFREDTIC